MGDFVKFGEKEIGGNGDWKDECLVIYDAGGTCLRLQSLYKF